MDQGRMPPWRLENKCARKARKIELSGRVSHVFFWINGFEVRIVPTGRFRALEEAPSTMLRRYSVSKQALLPAMTLS